MCMDFSSGAEFVAALDSTRSADTADMLCANRQRISPVHACGQKALNQSVTARCRVQKRRLDSTHDGIVFKRQRVEESTTDAQQYVGRLRCSLRALRDIVQAYPVLGRRAVIEQMNPNLQMALAAFMLDDKAVLEPCDAIPQRKSSTNRSCILKKRSRRPLSGVVGVRRIGSSSFKACMDIKALRIYTGGHSTMAEALQTQTLFRCVKAALHKACVAEPLLWQQADKVCNIFKNVFEAHGSSEQAMDLKVFVSMRADQWVGRKHHITSPVMSLEDAARLQARMVAARNHSWAAFRAIWIELMVCKKMMSVSDAARLIDEARRSVATKQFAKTMQDAMKALRLHAKVRAVQIRRTAALSRKTQMARAAEVVASRKLRDRRWQWLGRRDLTTEELLHGFPPELRTT